MPSNNETLISRIHDEKDPAKQFRMIKNYNDAIRYALEQTASDLAKIDPNLGTLTRVTEQSGDDNLIKVASWYFSSLDLDQVTESGINAYLARVLPCQGTVSPITSYYPPQKWAIDGEILNWLNRRYEYHFSMKDCETWYQERWGSDRNWRQTSGDVNAASYGAIFARESYRNDDADRHEIEVCEILYFPEHVSSSEQAGMPEKTQYPYICIVSCSDIMKDPDDPKLAEIGSYTSSDLIDLACDPFRQATDHHEYRGGDEDDRPYATLAEAMSAHDIPRSALWHPDEYDEQAPDEGDTCPVCNASIYPPTRHAQAHREHLMREIMISRYLAELDETDEIDPLIRHLLIVEVMGQELTALLDKETGIAIRLFLDGDMTLIAISPSFHPDRQDYDHNRLRYRDRVVFDDYFNVSSTYYQQDDDRSSALIDHYHTLDAIMTGAYPPDIANMAMNA